MLFGYDLGLKPEEMELLRALLLFVATAGGAIGAIFGGLLGWIIARWNLSRGEFSTYLSIDMVTFKLLADGGTSVRFSSPWEGELAEAMGSKGLAKLVAKAARSAKGVIKLKKPHHHGLFMARIEGRITGNIPEALVDAMDGLETHEVPVSFGGVYVGEDLSGDGRSDSFVTHAFVFPTEMIARLTDPVFVQSLRADKPRHAPWIPYLVKLAEQSKGVGEGHGGTNAVWHTSIDRPVR